MVSGVVSPIEPLTPVALDPYSGPPFWLGLAAAAGAAFAKYGPMAVDMYLRLAADRRADKKLQPPAAPATEERTAEPEPLPQHVGGYRTNPNPQPSLPDTPSRSEIDTRLGELRAELLREVAEAKAETLRLAERLDRLARAFERLKATVLRGIKDFAERLAKLEGWLDGWINGGGPGSRRR